MSNFDDFTIGIGVDQEDDAFAIATFDTALTVFPSRVRASPF